MTAIVKHISVHPDFKYHRRTGIFDDMDREANLKKHRDSKARQQYKANAFGFHYVDKTSMVKRPSPPTLDK
ncbi:hypothetical protein pEaSNUABM20_00217 [Erwinia phage pEa_SNUABM_20]|nr:hypothetical protein pEaSNUABM20_00217 [Erwinia phage pEa_SNUABM_20]